MTMPETVPVLKPVDFVIGPYQRGDCYCLIGWRNRIFSGGFIAYGSVPKAYKTFWDVVYDSENTMITSTYTPNTLHNRKLAARIWAKFIAKLGYTEDGPKMDL